MNVLIDTNVMIDYTLIRQPFFDSAKKILTLCDNKSLNGFVAAHSITNAFYILRKDYSVDERRAILKEFCEMLTVVGITEEIILSSLENLDFTDFEDCLQTDCAKSCGAKYIVTRNIKDYEKSSVPAILPEDFLKVLNM